MKYIKISFIIPVYNTSKYLTKCLNSVLKNNTLNNNIEVILVNDGSTDDSEKICQDYSRNFKNVIYTYKKNGGLSSARNTGVKLARGEYIAFIDSDDFINSDLLHVIIKKLSLGLKYDLVFLNAVKYYNDKIEHFGEYYDKIIINKNGNKYEVIKSLSKFNKYPGSAWNKIIRRELVLKNNLYFKEGLYSEDLDWSFSLFDKAKTFYYIEGDYYYYRQNRPGSITNNINLNNINSLIYILEKWSNYNFDKKLEKYFYDFLSYEYCILLYLYNKNIVTEDIKEKIYKLKFILKKSSKKKYKNIYFLVSIFNINIINNLLKILKRN